MPDNRNSREGSSGGFNRRSSGHNNDNNFNRRGDFQPGNNSNEPERRKRKRIMVRKPGGGNNTGNTEPVTPFKKRPGGGGGGGGFRKGGPPKFNKFDSAEKRTSKKIKPHQKSNKSLQYHELEFKLDKEIRLNRFLSNAGITSRREADKLIAQGVISINGEVVKELGTRVRPGDIVRYNGEIIGQERKVYFLLNKPKDTITTMHDTEGRRTVMDIMDNASPERIFPVGRLDRNTTGLLMFTNDGELSQRLTHPSFSVKKIYVASLDRKMKEEDMQKLAMGVELEDGFVSADNIAYYDNTGKEIIIEIHSGQNRVIHRMFDAIGYTVEALDRIFYAGLDKRNLRRGKWRSLTIKEVNMVRHVCGLPPLAFLAK